MLSTANPLTSTANSATPLSTTLRSLSASSSLTTEPQMLRQAASASGNGLKGEYFAGKDFRSLKLTRTDATVNFDWGSKSPATEIAADDFAVRWTGKIRPKYSETYTFSTTSDDGVRLWVNGVQLINRWSDSAAQENRGTISLQADRQYDIKLEYYENRGLATAQLKWSSAHQLKEIVPQSALFSSALAATATNAKPVIMGASGPLATTQSASLPIVGLSVSDADVGQGKLTVTLSATNGTLTVNSNVNGGVTLGNISNNGTRSVVLIGTLLQINAVLANPAGLVYRPNPGFQGTDKLNLNVNDNGSSAMGGPQSANQSLAINVGANPATQGKAPIGINIEGLDDWSTEWAFVDVFKTSRSWISQREGTAWGTGGPLALTPDGWVASLKPGQYAETPMLDNGKHYPSGKYTLFYDGEGKIDFGFQGVNIVSQSKGRMVLDITPQDYGVFLRIRETNPANPIRNIRLIMPGFENTYEKQPFHPLFLERLKNFKELRFMNWMRTNGSSVKEWSDRTTLNSARQTLDSGVAPEYMIQLANTLKIDPWFSIPHQASDDYVRKFATLVRDTLDPSLKAHIEYSNEVWNYGFEQTRYAEQKGQELGLSNDRFQGALRYYAQRSVEVFKIWEDVFGGTNRLVRVLASQSASSWPGEQVLTWKDAYKHADEYSIAPYFGHPLTDPAKVDDVLKMSQDQIIDSLLNDIRTDVKKQETEGVALAKRYGLSLSAYEGGPHLLSYQAPGDKEAKLTNLFTSVNRNPRMRDVYKEYLTQWEQVGGGLFNQFSSVGTYSKWGSWGALEYQDQDPKTAPKYLGLMDYMGVPVQ